MGDKIKKRKHFFTKSLFENLLEGYELKGK